MRPIGSRIIVWAALLSWAPTGLAQNAAKDPDLPVPLPMAERQFDGDAMAVDWPMVLQLACVSNLEVELAREKIRESELKLVLARQQWIPNLRIGATWMHHEGRIQEIDGRIIDASKNLVSADGLLSMQLDPQKVALDILKARQAIYARSGELERATRTAMRDVSLAYLNLVGAQASAAISLEVARLFEELVDRGQRFLEEGLATPDAVTQNKTQLQNQLVRVQESRQNQLSAGSQLVRLLNLPPGTRIYAADEYLAPLMIIDENRPEEELIQRSLSQGPGLAEVVAVLRALDETQSARRRYGLLPNVAVDLGQGVLGGGPGGSWRDFDGTADSRLYVYWNVSEIVGTRATRELFESGRRQATLQREQIRARLAAGIVNFRSQALIARRRIELAEQQIATAIRSYELSRTKLLNEAGRESQVTWLAVPRAIGSLAQARADYLKAVMDYNEAQIQLQYLIGFAPACDDCRRSP